MTLILSTKQIFWGKIIVIVLDSYLSHLNNAAILMNVKCFCSMNILVADPGEPRGPR